MYSIKDELAATLREQTVTLDDAISAGREFTDSMSEIFATDAGAVVDRGELIVAELLATDAGALDRGFRRCGPGRSRRRSRGGRGPRRQSRSRARNQSAPVNSPHDTSPTKGGSIIARSAGRKVSAVRRRL